MGKKKNQSNSAGLQFTRSSRGVFCLTGPAGQREQSLSTIPPQTTNRSGKQVYPGLQTSEWRAWHKIHSLP